MTSYHRPHHRLRHCNQNPNWFSLFIPNQLPGLRDWSLITGGGGGDYKTGGGQVKFYPCEKGGGGADKVLAMLKGGGAQNVLG